MDPEDIVKMESPALVVYFERLVRQGNGPDYYLVVWSRKELLRRLETVVAPPVRVMVERCPTCGGELVDGMMHDHRDDSPAALEGRPRADY